METADITTNMAGYDADQPSGSNAARKRKYITGAFTSRKRSAMACSFCRLRKTKCDNARPRCSVCRHHDATCIYEEGEATIEPEQERHNELVHRLDEIKQCLQHMQARDVRKSDPGVSASQLWALDSTISTPAAGPDDTATNTRNELDESGAILNPYLSPYRAARCEAVCRWPVFEKILTDQDAKIESFLHQPDADMSRNENGESDQRSKATFMDGRTVLSPSRIDVKDIIPLCKSFLGHVHFRNPILDPKELMLYAKNVVRDGVAWHAGCCLVLIVCAISCVLSGEKPASDHALTDSDNTPILADRILKNPLEHSEAYSQEAKKRLGLLGMSILDIKCYFFLSIYEKLRIRPLDSWFQLQQACMRLKAHLLRHTDAPEVSDPDRQDAHEVEQRVFWACVRAEIELLPDLCLPSSGLDTFRYPDFPAPPTITPGRQQWEASSETDDGELVPETLQAQSWLFFLAEISLRRTINANLRLLYRKSESYWPANPLLLLKHYDECEEQIRLWHSHLPARLQLEGNATQHQSLSFYLESRFSDWREYILRPLLYYALHHDHKSTNDANTASTMHTATSPQNITPTQINKGIPAPTISTTSPKITHLAQQHIALCTKLIPQASEHGRYGGTWQLCRRTFTCAMAILASVISPELQAPHEWLQLCELALDYLGQWAPEAESVEVMRQVLEGAVGRVVAGGGVGGRGRGPG